MYVWIICEAQVTFVNQTNMWGHGSGQRAQDQAAKTKKKKKHNPCLEVIQLRWWLCWLWEQHNVISHPFRKTCSLLLDTDLPSKSESQHSLGAHVPTFAVVCSAHSCPPLSCWTFVRAPEKTWRNMRAKRLCLEGKDRSVWSRGSWQGTLDSFTPTLQHLWLISMLANWHSIARQDKEFQAAHSIQSDKWMNAAGVLPDCS